MSACYCASVASHPVSKCLCSEIYQWMHHPQFSLHYTAVGAPTIRTVIAGLNSISLEWSPPSEGSPLSYTVTWTGSSVTSSFVLPAHNYTIRGLDSNTAYSRNVEVHSLANNATVSWNAHTLSQGKPELQSGVFRWRPFHLSVSYSSAEGKSTHWEVSSNVTATVDLHPNFPLCALPAKMLQLLHMCK